MEIKHNTQTGAIEFVTYIGGDGYTAPLVLKSDGTTQNYLYLQRDYQGSIIAISDGAGQVLEKRLFDAWGNVLVQDGAGNTLNGLTILDRGYTGHEHLLSVGLIHMNRRLYDSKLHRFLQPDNYVQDPSDTQNYNRYAYVLNNPLKYTDPSGELTENPNVTINPSPGSIDTEGFKRLMKDLNRFWGHVTHAWNTSNTKNMLDQISLNNIGKGLDRMKGWFKKERSEPGPSLSMPSNADIHMPTQHNSLGFNWTYLSQGAPGQRAIYGVANMFNTPLQWIMGRNVGNGSMRNLDGTAMTTDQGVMGFANTAMTLVGVAQVRAFLSEMYAARGVPQMVENTIYVTREGVALPKGARIPGNYVENPFRSGDYGEMINGRFESKVRIDQGTPRGFAGPERSHFHLNNGREHIFDISRWPWWY